MRKPIDLPVTNGRTEQWVQTDRKTHELWAQLITEQPKAAALAHILVARMGYQNAVLISQKTLAQLMGCGQRTVQTAIKVLEAAYWIQIVKINGPGTVAAYVVNDRVAWGTSRDALNLSSFSAVIVADAVDQTEKTLQHTDLRRIPIVYPGERQLSTTDDPLPDLPKLKMPKKSDDV